MTAYRVFTVRTMNRDLKEKGLRRDSGVENTRSTYL